MRIPLLIVLLIASFGKGYANGPLIQEVRFPAPVLKRGAGAVAPVPGAVSLFNPGPDTVWLKGLVWVHHDARVVTVEEGAIPPGGSFRFTCAMEGGEHTLPLELSRMAGSLMLFAADGARLLDLFTWPALPPDVHLIRLQDGSDQWTYLQAGAGEGVTPAIPVMRRSPPPVISEQHGHVAISATAGHAVRFALHGDHPGGGGVYDGPFTVPGPTLVRAVSMAPDALPSTPVDRLCGLPPGEPWLSLAMDPTDLWHPESGIDVYGERANFSRSGPEHVRAVHATLDSGAVKWSVEGGLRISGSGSRSYPKRSYNLALRERYGSGPGAHLPGEGTLRTLVLRADATPHAMLRHLFMTQVVHRAGDRLEVQDGLPLPLYINGAFHGAYRVMPAKDADMLARRIGGGPVEIMEGPEARPVRGTADHYQASLSALREGGPWSVLEERIDLASLIELACLEMYMGRGDHDLNMRCWRPATPSGRWRWVLYDLDLWAPADDPSLGRLLDAHFAAAPYLGGLLDHPDLRGPLLARLSALLATVLSPAQAIPLVDSLYARHHILLDRDAARWGPFMEVVSAASTRALLHEAIRIRPRMLHRQLEQLMGTPPTPLRIVPVDPAEGTILVEELAVDPAGTVVHLWPGTQLRVRAQAAPGMVFAGWKGTAATGADVKVMAGRVRQLKAVFKPATASPVHRLKQSGEERRAIGVPQ